MLVEEGAIVQYQEKEFWASGALGFHMPKRSN